MAMLITGRFFGGVAVGMLTSTIPMYASELSTPKWRGALSGLLQWFLSWGFLIAQWLGYGCSFSNTAFSCKSAQLRVRTVSETHILVLKGDFLSDSSASLRSF